MSKSVQSISSHPYTGHRDLERTGRRAMNGEHVPLNEKEQCMVRHERIRIAILFASVVCMFLSAILFFTLHMILPMILVTAVAIIVYLRINMKLRQTERLLS